MVNPLNHLPVIGKWARRVGQIEQILAVPCSTTPEIVVEAFFVNIPQLIWSIEKPDANDLLFERFKVRHHRGRKWKFNINDITQGLGDAEKLPGYGKFLFRAAEFAQRVGWYMMVIDASLDFAVNWTSTVYQWEGCKVGHGAWMSIKNAGQPAVPTIGFQGRILWNDSLEGDANHLAPGGTGVLALANETPVVTFHLVTRPLTIAGVTAPHGTVTAELRDPAGKVVTTSDPATPIAGLGTAASFHRIGLQFYAENEYQLWYKCEGGYADLTGTSISIANVKNNGIGADP